MLSNVICTAWLSTAVTDSPPLRYDTGDDVDAGAGLEQFAGEMRQPAGTGIGIVELARIGFGVVDELLQRLGRKRRVHHEDLKALATPWRPAQNP